MPFRLKSILMEWVYDIIIFSFLSGSVVAIFLLSKYGERWMSLFVTDLLILLLAISWGVIFYGSFLEPREIVVNQQSVNFGLDPDQYLHALVISDIHAGTYKGVEFVSYLIDTINEAHPDVIFLLGDFVSYDAAQAEALEPFKNITAVYPTYAVLGNHDYQLESAGSPTNWENGQAVAAKLKSFGIHVLHNEGLEVAPGMWLAGIDEIWTNQEIDIAKSLAGRPDGDKTIMIVHNPDLVLHMDPSQRVNLLLAGHTHGGQIRLPLIGPVPNIPDQLGRAYDKGWFDYLGQRMFITSGVGESGTRARLFNPPEIVSMFIRY